MCQVIIPSVMNDTSGVFSFKWHQTCLHVAMETSPLFLVAAWLWSAAMCCSHPLSEEVANWCGSCWVLPGPAKWRASIKLQLSGIHLALQSCSINFLYPRAAYLRHEHSFHGTLRSRAFLEQHAAHTGHTGLWTEQRISQRGLSFWPDACCNERALGVRRFGMRPDVFLFLTSCILAHQLGLSGYNGQISNSHCLSLNLNLNCNPQRSLWFWVW